MDGSSGASRRVKKRQTEEISSNQIDQEIPSNSSKKIAHSSNLPNSNILSTLSLIKAELKCLVCLQLMEDPYATVCAHSFCHQCLRRSLEFKSKCPKCGFALEDRPGHIFPNFTLQNLTKMCHEFNNKVKEIPAEIPSSSKSLTTAENLVDYFNNPEADLQTVLHMIDVLNRKRAQLERNRLTLPSTETSVVPSPTQSAAGNYADSDASMCDQKHSLTLRLNDAQTLNTTPVQPSLQNDDGPSLINRRRRLRTHFDDLEQQYLNNRIPSPFEAEISNNGLNKFSESLSKMTQFSNFKLLGTLNYNVDMYSGLSIVSSIEFDRDGELFTIAGVTKKIKLYEYETVLKDSVDIHYPVCEMQCGSKISCVSWNPYNRGLLASSDYEGIVQLWDVYSGASIKKFQEHEKRCWSVCFNFKDPNLMASGSDDAKVKLWSVNCKSSIGTIEAKVNVCCVHFNPESRDHLAFGSADHCVHYYDLRNPKQPATIFRGHKKAVSYVKFLNAREVVSASTDSQLRLWSIDSGQCVRIFKGHQNEKNFVGLDTDSDFIACGSENNLLYIYYKELSKPLLTYPFRVESSLLDRERVEPDSNDFVSAVCWKKKSNVVLAANSLGTIRILELS